LKKRVDKILDDYIKEDESRIGKANRSRIEDRESASETSEYSNKENIEIKAIFLNTIVTVMQVKTLREKKTLQEEVTYIADMFGLRIDSHKEHIIIDFYRDIYKFCLKSEFTVEKISTLLSIMYFIFNYSVGNKKIIKENSCSIFNHIIEYHSINRPPYFYEIFNKKDKCNIITYINKTFYRNYTLYENLFKYNMNMNIYSRDFPKIGEQFPKLTNLAAECLDYFSIPILDTIIDPVKRKQSNFKEKEKEIKTIDVRKLEEESERSKNKSNFSTLRFEVEEKTEKEKQREFAIIEHETNEAKKYLDTRIPDILKEADETTNLANMHIMDKLEKAIAQTTNKK
jgi:hypothetical protein